MSESKTRSQRNTMIREEIILQDSFIAHSDRVDT